MRRKLHTTRARGFVFGMSGGVDSNVMALLAREAAGPEHLGLIMPIHNDPSERADAERVADRCGINIRVIELTQTYDSMLGLLPPGDELTRTNFKSRLRMSVLYYHANVMQYLVLGTINKVEHTIGYFAKYGSYGDILPLTRLLKREVRALGRELGLPEDLVAKKASGCIIPGTYAEDEWGIPEDELDEVIAHWDDPDLFHPRLKDLRRLDRIASHKRGYPPIFRPACKKDGC